jgi:hypothetical protein
MKVLFLVSFLISTLSSTTYAAGFHETSFDLVTAGTVYFGISPLFSTGSYDSSTSSSYTSWGYQALVGFDYSFSESFGSRVYASYAHATGNNAANTDTINEKVTTNDFEIGGMLTFDGWAIGGGIMPRASSFDYVNGSTSFSSSYSGMLKFGKASLDFTSKGGKVGFSIAESYIFGDVGDTTIYKVAEWKTSFNVSYLLNLK